MTDATNALHHLPTPVARAVLLRELRVLLLAEVDPEITALVLQLAADDVEVVTAPSAEMAMFRLHGEQPSAVLLAAELGPSTGYAALEELREVGTIDMECPAIAFSDEAGPLNRLRALQRGCLDFLALPIFYPELVARLQIAIARPVAQRSILRVPGGLHIDLKAHRVVLGGQAVELSALEFKLLVKLATDPSRLWTKQELLTEVWGFKSPGRTRTMDSHACRLRQKLREAGDGRHEYVHNIWGTGYRLLSSTAL